jgi:tRNA(fMet)-specific endonuclease VapC
MLDTSLCIDVGDVGIYGSMDLLIAAHAVSLGVPLATANDREFRRVAGLRVENWAR